MSAEYWNNKLEATQECIFYVRRIIAGRKPAQAVSYLVVLMFLIVDLVAVLLTVYRRSRQI